MYRVIYWSRHRGWIDDEPLYGTEAEAIERCRQLAELGYLNAHYVG